MVEKDVSGKRDGSPSPSWLRAGVVALAVIVALVAWLATRDGDDDSASDPEPAATRILSEEELIDAAGQLDQPVFWAGPREGSELELEDLGEGGGARVRYVPEGSEAGETPGEVLTVGSYPLPDPAQALEEFAGRPGAIVREAGDGTEVVSSEERPTSVYFVDPENSVQVEVYDPDPAAAMSLALSGDVRPVE